MTHGKESRSQDTGREAMEAAVRAALERLRLGVPEHPKNRDLLAREARRGDRRVLNVRMLCRESGLSPTTVYRRCSWAVSMLQAEENAAGQELGRPPSAGEVISGLKQENAALNRALGVLRAECHQLAQANIVLGERLEGAERARQAAVDVGRRRRSLPQTT